jgi:colanic acid/amylovoran biosynthesis glycosyltransferase
MKVAFIVDRFPAVSETFILDQLTGLIRRGHDVDVFARYAPDEGVTHPDVEKYDILARTSYFGPPLAWTTRIASALAIIARRLASDPRMIGRALDPRRSGRDALSLWTLHAASSFARSASRDYDVLHCHFGPNGLIGSSLRDVLDLPSKLVTSFYGFDASLHLWARDDGPYGRLFAEGDRFIALSDHMQARLTDIGCPTDRIEKLPLGVALNELPFRARSAAEGDRAVILTVARLVEKKGLEYSIQAIAALVERYPDIVYRIAGDGPSRDKLERLIRELDVSQNVQLLGWLDRQGIRRQLDEADLFVLPSVTAKDGDEEGTPTVLLEAQAVGLPVISTAHSGIPEIVEDGRSGFLVPERDAAALAERIGQLLEHPETWAEMGRAGRTAVEARHDTDRLSERLERIYESVVPRKSDTERGT